MPVLRSAFHEEGPLPREFPLNGIPCANCGQPALAFIPAVGVRHRTGWCLTGTDPAPWLPPVIAPPYPPSRAA